MEVWWSFPLVVSVLLVKKQEGHFNPACCQGTTAEPEGKWAPHDVVTIEHDKGFAEPSPFQTEYD